MNMIWNNLFNQIPNFNFLMKFLFIYFNKTSLHVGIERGNPDIIRLILSRPETDVNAKSI